MQLTAMKVGKLSKLSGITVRTLHFYDEIGLLKPSRRTDSATVFTQTEILPACNRSSRSRNWVSL